MHPHAIVRNNTEIPGIPDPLPLIGNLLQNCSKYYNRDIDIDTIRLSYTVSFFIVLICVCG